MYAIVEIAGQQFRVQSNQEIFVHRLEGNAGDQLSFNKVLMVSDDTGTKVGMPTVEGASVSATIVSHDKGDKVIVFKKKRRKGYKVKNGHRQCFTRIRINEIA
jgi:large subunit ribosomal protein L21